MNSSALVALLALTSFLSCASLSWRMSVSMSIQPSMSNTKYPLRNDLMVRAARGEVVERTPVWVFRQAGRHLPEYTQYKKDKNRNFLEMLEVPEDVAEVTMQPVRRYNLDAAILFSDILVILQAMDFQVTMPGGVGIQVPSPLKGVEDMYRVPQSVDVRGKLAHVFRAVELIKEELRGSVPLIGFSAAPWTLMYYLVGGSSKKNQSNGSTWLREHPTQSGQIMNLLTDIVIEYLSLQVQAGADIIQVFEAMGEFISEGDFTTWALPSMARIASELKTLHPHVPLMVFPRNAPYAIEALQTAGYDVVSLDTHVPRADSRRRLATEADRTGMGVAAVQGNLDVTHLQGNAGNTPESVRAAVATMLSELGPQKLIANLGEGLGGREDPLLVAAFIDSVHQLSEEMIQNQ